MESHTVTTQHDMGLAYVVQQQVIDVINNIGGLMLWSGVWSMTARTMSAHDAAELGSRRRGVSHCVTLSCLSTIGAFPRRILQDVPFRLTEERKLFDPIAFVQRSWKLDRTAPVVLLPPLLKLGQQVFLFGNPIVKGNHPSGLRSIISCLGTRRWAHTHHSTAASTSGALVGSAGAGDGAVAAATLRVGSEATAV